MPGVYIAMKCSIVYTLGVSEHSYWRPASVYLSQALALALWSFTSRHLFHEDLDEAVLTD